MVAVSVRRGGRSHRRKGVQDLRAAQVAGAEMEYRTGGKRRCHVTRRHHGTGKSVTEQYKQRHGPASLASQVLQIAAAC